MKFESTRKKVPPINFSQALFEGLAKDGGLYVPEELPLFDITSFSKEATLIDVAQEIITPFVDEPLKKEVVGICQRAFNFPIPLSVISKSTSILELYHGPTGAFKDVGARFLSECILKIGNGEKRTIIVATSGDTGGAVAGAFHGKPNIDVIILYPKGMISDFQEKQLTCWGNKVHAYKVNGTFDDCQRLVKEALLDKKWSKKNLTSANSINIGRILPQTIYYGWSALHYYNRNQRKPGFIIPSGNLGNSLAALWAKKMGFPIGEVILSFNANKSVVNYFETGKWTPQPTITTLANAMDVGNPSNMERLKFLSPDLQSLKKDVEAFSVSDEEIKEAIKESKKNWNRILCPHTATAAYVRSNLTQGDWIIVATADAAKFASIVQPLVENKIKFPSQLKRFENCKSQSQEIEAQLDSLSSKVGLDSGEIL